MALPHALHNRLRLPVLAAPMFLVSGPALVVAACRAGVLGSLPAANQRTTDGLEAWLDRLDAELGPADAPYGVNLVVHRSNPRLAADLAAVVRHRVPVVITSLGAVSSVVEAVHSYGGIVLHDVTNAGHARRAAEAGVDGIICVAAGAGGHAGTLSPFALLAEVRAVFGGTLVLAGSVTTGADVLAARAMGADLVSMGTRFLATAESMASAAYVEEVVRSGAGDVVLTPSVSTVPANFLRGSLTRAGLDPESLTAPERVDLTHLTNPDEREVKAWRDIWSAGHGVAGVRDAPSVAELVDRLEREYREARARVCGDA